MCDNSVWVLVVWNWVVWFGMLCRVKKKNSFFDLLFNRFLLFSGPLTEWKSVGETKIPWTWKFTTTFTLLEGPKDREVDECVIQTRTRVKFDYLFDVVPFKSRTSSWTVIFQRFKTQIERWKRRPIQTTTKRWSQLYFRFWVVNKIWKKHWLFKHHRVPLSRLYFRHPKKILKDTYKYAQMYMYVHKTIQESPVFNGLTELNSSWVCKSFIIRVCVDSRILKSFKTIYRPKF